RADDGLHARLEARTYRRARIHASGPTQQQEGGNGLTSSQNSSGMSSGAGRNLTILLKSILRLYCLNTSSAYALMAAVGSLSNRLLNFSSLHAFAWILPQS